jgi:hypothetical protein
MANNGTWVRRQPLVALPGTPMWTTVQTQPNESLRMQIAALDPNAPPPSARPQAPSVAVGRSTWSFDGDGALFRLVSEAHRIRLAHLFDPVLAVHISNRYLNLKPVVKEAAKFYGKEARLVDSDPRVLMPVVHGGTPVSAIRYLSPEQAERGPDDIDARSDKSKKKGKWKNK